MLCNALAAPDQLLARSLTKLSDAHWLPKAIQTATALSLDKVVRGFRPFSALYMSFAIPIASFDFSAPPKLNCFTHGCACIIAIYGRSIGPFLGPGVVCYSTLATGAA